MDAYKSRSRREVVERASEVHILIKDLAEERDILNAELLGDPAIGPLIKSGGSLKIGIFTISGKLYHPDKCSDWERRNLPRSSTDRIVKIFVSRGK